MPFLIRHIDKIVITAFCWIPFLCIMYSSMSGVPFNDDYDMFLHSLSKLKNSTQFTNSLEILFSQHMEHRPAYPRIVAFGVWKIVGTCDLKILTLIGNFMLFLTWVLLNQTTVKLKLGHRFLFGLITFLVLTSMQSMENLIWATGALQNYSFTFFSTCAIYSIWHKKNTLGIICWILSVCCTITGFILIPILFLLILRQSKITVLIVFSLIVTLTCILYFYHISFPPIEKWPFIIPQKSISAKLNYFLAFLGSSFTLSKNTVTQSIIWGASLLLISCIVNRKISSWDFWTYMSIFIVLVALTGVAFRSVLGPEQALSERYKIYSELLLIAGIYKIFMKNRKMRNWSAIILCIVGLQFIFTGKYYSPKITERKNNLDIGFYELTAKQNPLLLTYPNPIEGAAKMITAYELGIYKAP